MSLRTEPTEPIERSDRGNKPPWRIPIDVEATRFVLGALLAGSLAALFGRFVIGSALFAAVGLGSAVLFAIGCLLFFRDPDRQPPSDPLAVLSPADGRVTAVDHRTAGTTITIFLSVLNVHINRAPLAGEVTSVNYRRGKFLAAYRPEAAAVNEANELVLASVWGPVRTIQIAGWIARRIVCRVSPGDRLQAGDRFGLIRFGSCTQLILPPGFEPQVAVGDRVRGGSSVLARRIEGSAR